MKRPVSRCKACGAPIRWIKMKSGKAMPVDAQPIPYRLEPPSYKDALTLVTPEGKVCKGTYDPGADTVGYISHFATCPAAKEMRRAKR